MHLLRVAVPHFTLASQQQPGIALMQIAVVHSIRKLHCTLAPGCGAIRPHLHQPDSTPCCRWLLRTPSWSSSSSPTTHP